MMAAHYHRLADGLSDVYTPPAEYLSALNTGDTADQDRLRSHYAEFART